MDVAPMCFEEVLIMKEEIHQYCSTSPNLHQSTGFPLGRVQCDSWGHEFCTVMLDVGF